MRLRSLASGLLAAIVLPCDTGAQSARAGALLQTYMFGDATAGIHQAQLLTLPVELSWALPHAWIRLEGSYADGILTYPDGGHTAMSGPTDTRLVAGSSVSILSVRALAVVPSGDHRYAPGEIPLLGVLASELLPFAVETLGGGGAYGGEAELAGSRGRWSFAATGGYVAARAHAPFEAIDLPYRPGNQTRLRLTIARRVGSASSLGVVTSYQHPTAESYGDEELYQPGDRWDAAVSFAHPFGARESVSARAAVYTRSRGSVVVHPAKAGSILPGIVGSAARRLLTLGADLQLMRRGVVIVPEGEVRLLSTEDGVGEGWLATLGVGVDRRILGGRYGTRLVGSTSARVHVGSITAAGGGNSVRGWELGLGIRLEPGG